MKISACMIAKNEEKALPRCLDSIKELCDEIILIDTGSTDKTIEIAESYGAFVVTSKWKDDFSLHRNQAFGYADQDPNTWYLVIDCDEELAPMDVSAKEFKEERMARLPAGCNALAVTVNEMRKGKVVQTWLGQRFFKAEGNPHYIGYIHNKPRFEGGGAGSDIILYHHGYTLPPEIMKIKHDRTMNLLNRRIKEDPEDFNAMFYLCQMASGRRHHEEAIYWGTRCLDLFPGQDYKKLSYFGILYFLIGLAHLNLEDGEKAYSWIRKGLEFFPDDIDLNYGLARIGYMSKRNDFLKEGGDKYIDLLNKYYERQRPQFEDFANIIHPGDFDNRTVYTVNQNTERQVLQWLKDEKIYED